MKRYLTLLLLLLTGLPACAPQTPAPKGITVAAAASLSDAFHALGEAFTAQTAIPVTFSFAATGTLSEQVRNGAPFDVFAAADTRYVDDLIQEGHLRPDSRTVFAQGDLVLAFADGTPGNALDDLQAPRFRHIALANPEIAPFGLAAQQTLQASGLWDALQARLVFGESVRQTLQFVINGDAQAGFVPRGFAEKNGLRYTPIAPTLYSPILMSGAALTNSPNPEQAMQFLDFLLSPQAQDLLEQSGFRKSP